MSKQSVSNREKVKIVVGYLFIVPLVVLIAFGAIATVRSRLLFSNDRYYAYYRYGNDIRNGTPVTLNGINIGEVYRVELTDDNRVKVEMRLRKRYLEKITEESVAKIVRPILIGNKQINIIPGSRGSKQLEAGSEIRAEESSELIDLVSGTSLSDFVRDLNMDSLLGTGDGTSISVSDLYNQAISALVMMNRFQESLNELAISMGSMNSSLESMSVGMNSLDEMGEAMVLVSESMESMQTLSGSMESIASSIKTMDRLTGSMDSLSGDLDKMADSIGELSKLGDEMGRLNNSLEGLGEMGDMTTKLGALVDELYIVIKAMEETALLKSKVRKVREKEQAKSQ